MKALLGATALSLAMVVSGAVPAAATDINIHVYGEEGPSFGPGPHGKGHGPHMRGHGKHHRMHGGDEGRHDSHSRRRDRDDERWGHRGRGHGGKKGHGRRTERMLRMIEIYDQDGNGKVTQDEVDQTRADRLAAFDADGDGMLTLEEYEALWLDAMRERMVDRFQSHDDDGDGQVTVEEFSKRTGHLVLRADRNEDGAISLEDMRRGDRGGPKMQGKRGRHMLRDRDDAE